MDNIPYDVIILAASSEVNSFFSSLLYAISLIITAYGRNTANLNLTTGSTADDCISAY